MLAKEILNIEGIFKDGIHWNGRNVTTAVLFEEGEKFFTGSCNGRVYVYYKQKYHCILAERIGWAYIGTASEKPFDALKKLPRESVIIRHLIATVIFPYVLDYNIGGGHFLEVLNKAGYLEDIMEKITVAIDSIYNEIECDLEEE